MNKPAEKVDRGQNSVVGIETNQALAKKLEQKKQTIKNTVAKKATDDELDMFMHLAKEYNLDPFQGEIYFWKFGKKDPTIMTSRDGYLKIANQHPSFDGMDSGVIYPGDDFKKTADGVEHSLDISNMGKQPIGAYAVVYRSDREVPTRVVIPFQDYNKDNKVWNNYPSAMIQKCAESMALKRAFSVSGLVSKEEMGYEQDSQPQQFAEQNVSASNSNSQQATNQAESEPQQVNKLSERQQEISNLLDEHEKEDDLVVEYLKEQEVSGVDELGDDQYKLLKQEITDGEANDAEVDTGKQ